MAPLRAAAGEHHLAIEDALALQAGHCQPVALAAQIGHVLAVRERDRLEARGLVERRADPGDASPT